MRVLVFLHVLTMILAVGISGGAEILIHRVAGTRDLAGIRTTFGTYATMARLIPVAFILGLLFGLIAIFAEGFDPFQPWLISAYVLFVAGIVIGNVMNGGWAARLAAASATAADASDPAFVTALEDSRGRIGLILFWLITAALVFVMIVKPLS